MNPKISVIVPVYKVEKYIKLCIDSILAQTYTDWELILIDDGSPDRSGFICDRYAEKDKRIKVFHKQNAGVSAARNFALELSKGEWVTFVDSDDWLEADCFTCCMQEVEMYDLDLLQMSYQRVNDNFKILLKNQAETRALTSVEYVHQNNLLVCAGGNFMKKSIILENNLRFDTRIKLGEDQLFVYTYIANCNLCKRLNNLFYNYRYNVESASVVSKPDECIKSIKTFQNFSLRNEFDEQIQKTIYQFVLTLVKSRQISFLSLYKVVRSESFKSVASTRKLDIIFLYCYRVSKLVGLILLYIFRNKI